MAHCRQNKPKIVHVLQFAAYFVGQRSTCSQNYYRDSSLGDKFVSDKFCFSQVCPAEYYWPNRSNHYDLDQTKKFKAVNLRDRRMGVYT